MDRVNIIHDLLDWIETHLDQPLLLDNVAAKSGYSKWHLQRMFRSTTGHALGSYIREASFAGGAGAAFQPTSDPGYRPAIPFRLSAFVLTRLQETVWQNPGGLSPHHPLGRLGMAGAAVEAEAEPRHDGPTLPRWYAGKPPEGVCTSWMGLR